ncbi:histamine N-methyltransferase A-like [Amphiura filiformis]|uniref:histamine N-methyltransferase A-like n=1 Tax=Amphiura filiformis TaxID=82378 RepID=UPI003B21373E
MVESDKSVMPIPIFNDQAYYTKAFNYFTSVGNYFEAVQKWTDETFCGHVVEKLIANIGDGTGDKPLRVLGVGSGSGEIEIVFLNKLLLKFSKIHTCVVEPCVNLLAQYQVKTKDKAANITFDWQNRTFEEFVKLQQGNSLKYHFISACNSMYYVKNLDEALQSLYDMLAPGGILLVTISADYFGIGKLWRKFRDFGFETASQDGSPESDSSLSHHRDSAHVHDALRQLQIPYYIDDYRCHFKITQCFDEKETEEGNLALDFLTQTMGFRNAPKDLFQQVLTCIKDCSVQRDDDWFFQTEHVCFFITKPT